VLVAKNTKNLFNANTLRNIREYYATMNEYDEHGYAPIHQSAQRSLLKSIEKFVQTNRNQLELETQDEYKFTAFLVAVKYGQITAVKLLTDLGSQLDATTAQGLNAVELAAAEGHTDIVDYFVTLNSPKLQPWPTLFKLLASLAEDDVHTAARCLKPLLQERADGSVSRHWEAALSNGVVPAVIASLKNDIDTRAKLTSFRLLLHLTPAPAVQSAILAHPDALTVLNRLVDTTAAANSAGNSSWNAPALMRMLGRLYRLLSSSRPEQASVCVKAGGLGALCRCLGLLSGESEPDALAEVVEAIGAMVKGNPSHQSQVNKEPTNIRQLVSFYRRSSDGQPCLHKGLLFALTHCVASLAEGHRDNQCSLVEAGAGPSIVFLCRAKSKDLQQSAIDCLRVLVDGNPDTQRSLLSDGAVLPLLSHLKRARSQENQAISALAIWRLAGADPVERRTMATMIGIQTLLDFIQTTSEQLHLIAADALSVLAEGPVSQRLRICDMNGISALVRLLRSEREQIVACAIRALRHLCVGVGNTPSPKVQARVVEARGLKFLVALMVHARDEAIQMEAALAASAVVMGNQEAAEDLNSSPEFSYIGPLRCLYSEDRPVRQLAASALSGFAYNNVREQKKIASLGGVKYANFLEFLQSTDEIERALAAYQTIILARIIPDEDQSISSARGIKILYDLLTQSQSAPTQWLVADLIACLAHSRAGLPQALIGIGAIDGLARLIQSPLESVRGCASVALGYLSHEPSGRRFILTLCRRDPFVMKSILFYSKDCLAPQFTEGWHHYQRVGLPPIRPGRPQLVTRRTADYRAEHEPTMVTLIDRAAPPLTPAPSRRGRRYRAGTADSEDDEDDDDDEPGVEAGGIEPDATGDAGTNADKEQQQELQQQQRALSRGASTASNFSTVA
ncbi:hypothetical protein BOX15_Mlig028079g1, partial [Macrostomum lignano]